MAHQRAQPRSKGPSFQAPDDVSHADRWAQCRYIFPCFKRRWKSGILYEISRVFNVNSPSIKMVGGLNHRMCASCQSETSNLENDNGTPAYLARFHGNLVSRVSASPQHGFALLLLTEHLLKVRPDTGSQGMLTFQVCPSSSL